MLVATDNVSLPQGNNIPRTNGRPPVCEKKWTNDKVCVGSDVLTIITPYSSHDEGKLERSVSRPDTVTTMSSSSTSMPDLRSDDTLASDSLCWETERRPVEERLYSQAMFQTKKLEEMRNKGSIASPSLPPKERVTMKPKRKTSAQGIGDRLYNLSKDKQENGKKRREAIAMASMKKKSLPKKEDFGVIPLSQATNMYNKGVKMLHEKKSKLKEAKIRLDGHHDFGKIPLDQSDNMYVKGVHCLRQKQFSIAQKQEMEHHRTPIRELIIPEISITSLKSTIPLSEIERRNYNISKGILSARAIRSNSSKSLKAVTVREEITQIIEQEVGEIGVKFSEESFEKLCRVALRE